MPGFLTAVDHSLGQAEAQIRVSTFLDQVHNQYQDMVSSWSGEWEDNKLNFELIAMNMKVTGVVEVTEDAVLVGGKIRCAILMLNVSMENTMREELRKLLVLIGRAVYEISLSPQSY
ncbi:MAG: polyhydroxyalkanoic acid system family protein [Pirellulales bacterium]|nr:polyhydroxyalkanoic acid system family protein [Pirellulales bacterium]